MQALPKNLKEVKAELERVDNESAALDAKIEEACAKMKEAEDGGKANMTDYWGKKELQHRREKDLLANERLFLIQQQDKLTNNDLGEHASEALQEVWKKLRTAKVSSGKFLSWNRDLANVLGIACPDNTLLVREAYMELIDKILYSMDIDITLVGTSGTGKSVFALYMLWRCLHIPKKSILSKMEHIYYHAPDGSIFIFHLQDENEPVIRVTNPRAVSVPPRVLYIYDASAMAVQHPPIHCEGKIVKLATTSTSTTSTIVCMPLWDAEELNKLARIRSIDKKVCIERFEKFGGVVRSVLAVNTRQEDWNLAWELQRARVTGFHGLYSTEDATSTSSVVLMDPKETIDEDGRITFDYTHITYSLASPYVLDQLLQTHAASTMVWKDELQPLTPFIRGLLSQPMIMSFFPCCLQSIGPKEFSIWDLDSSEDKKETIKLPSAYIEEEYTVETTELEKGKFYVTPPDTLVNGILDDGTLMVYCPTITKENGALVDLSKPQFVPFFEHVGRCNNDEPPNRLLVVVPTWDYASKVKVKLADGCGIDKQYALILNPNKDLE